MGNKYRRAYNDINSPNNYWSIDHRYPWDASDEGVEDWESELRKSYKRKTYDKFGQWMADNQEALDKEGEDFYNAEQDYLKARNQAGKDIFQDPGYKDLMNRKLKASNYGDIARHKGWVGTALKQDREVQNLTNDITKYTSDYIGSHTPADVADRYNNFKTPKWDEYASLYNDLEKEYNDEVAAKKKSFDDAANGKEFYYGLTTADDGKTGGHFFYKNGDGSYKRVGTRTSYKHPFGSNRGITDIYGAPDATQEFEDYPEDKIEYLTAHKDANKARPIGEIDSTD